MNKQSTGRRKFTSSLIISAMFATYTGYTNAQTTYPDKAIKILVGYPAGGGADSVTRTVANKLSQRLGVPVLVENKPGASGMIAADMVAKSKPDGYTLIMMPADGHSIAPHVYPNIKYKALEDFTYLTLIGTQPMALIVKNSTPVNNATEFFEHARKNGENMTFASYGIGSSSHVAMAMLEQYGKFKNRHIPYQGSAPAAAAVMAGTVDAMMIPTPLGLANSQSGKVKLIGIATQKESAVAKGQPYFGQINVPIDASVWVGIMGPAKMPVDVANKLNKELAEIMKDDAVRKTLEATGTEANVENNTMEYLQRFYTTEYQRWGDVVKAAKITVNE